MNAADVLAFCLLLAVSSVSYSIQQTNKRSLPPVGEGVTVHARILYDHTLKSGSVLKNGDTKDDNVPTLKDFKELFWQVQQYFNNQSIIIKITVENATENDTLRVPYGSGSSLDANKTLEKLMEYAMTQSPSNDTIFYYFTKSELLQASKIGDHLELELTEKATHNTFCTGEVSAAVVTYFPEGIDRHMSAVKATADVFGLRKYNHFTLKDFIQLLFMFSHCPKSACWTQCLLEDRPDSQG